MTKEQIHNIYLHMTGKAEGLLEAGAEADFPIMFAEAIIQYNKPRELTEDEILELSNTMPYANRFEFARAILKKAQEK
jgi:hypothetical protein